MVRIGGNSADFSWWPIEGTMPPVGIHYALTNGWLRTTQAFAAALGARLIMGVNLAGGRPAIAAAEARAFLRGIGTRYLQAFEIGNEPDLYNFPSGSPTAEATASPRARRPTTSTATCRTSRGGARCSRRCR